MKKLDIPLILQDATSLDCGPTCVSMVLSYLGIEKDTSQLKENLDYDAVGTTAHDNGTLLLDEGLRVTAITAQPILFPPDVVETLDSQSAIVSYLDKKREELPKYERWLGAMKKFTDKGGEFILEIPTFDHIKKAIDDGGPIIALIYAKALGSREGGFHFVIVNGYDEDRVFITNPGPSSKKQDWFPIEQFLYALHTSTLVELDNGTLLVVSKK